MRSCVFRRDLLAALLAGVACAGPRTLSPPVPPPAADDILWTLLLLGDAGRPGPDDPVLAALRAATAERPDRTTVIFLGDNLYPAGLPDTASPERAEMEARLARQVDAVRGAGPLARAVFVPGNHDWAHHGPDGWVAIRRQRRFLAARGAGTAELLPPDGCPGPVTRDVGPAFRLVFLDTQWWLHQHARPLDPDSACPADSDAEVVEALARAVRAPDGRKVIVAAHHPLVSGGKHGGHFGLMNHLFPLRDLASWAWLPLPVLGSAYPLARQLGISRQDVGNGRNREMRRAIETALAGAPPLVFAAGHEHGLQVLAGGPAARWLLVSGAGYFGHTSRLAWLDSTRYAAEESGFMRVDALASGRVRLGVIEVNAAGGAREAFSLWLE
jgi:hypothetical protein